MEGGAIEGDLWRGSYRGGPMEGGTIEGDLWRGEL